MPKWVGLIDSVLGSRDKLFIQHEKILEVFSVKLEKKKWKIKSEAQLSYYIGNFYLKKEKCKFLYTFGRDYIIFNKTDQFATHYSSLSKNFKVVKLFKNQMPWEIKNIVYIEKKKNLVKGIIKSFFTGVAEENSTGSFSQLRQFEYSLK